MNYLLMDPEYNRRKIDALEGMVIEGVSSLTFKGKKSEVEKLRNKAGNTYTIDKYKDNGEIGEGIVLFGGAARMTWDQAKDLLGRFPNLKWSFFYLENRGGDTEEKDIHLGVAYSRSGSAVTDLATTVGRYATREDAGWCWNKSVVNSRNQTYSFPFTIEWKQNLYYEERGGKTCIAYNGDTRFIPRVQNNQEMFITYKSNISQFNKALKNECFYEALLVGYALLEEVSFEILYHLGLFGDRTTRKAYGPVKNKMMEAINIEDPTKFKVDMISEKIKIIRGIAEWTDTAVDIDKNDEYLARLKSAMESTDIQSIINTCNYILWWLQYRNEIMHAMMKCKAYSQNQEIKAMAMEGMALFRELDKQRECIKKGKLRQFLRLK